MSGPPGLLNILKRRKFNPLLEFPKDIKEQIHLCDDMKPTVDEYKDQLNNVSLKEDFPIFDYGYDNELFFDKKEQKLLKKTSISQLALTEELSKRKERKKAFKEIYAEMKKIYEEGKESIRKANTNTSNEKDEKMKKETKKLLQKSNLASDSTDSSADERSSSSSDAESYNNSSSDDDMAQRTIEKQKKKGSTKKQVQQTTNIKKKQIPEKDKKVKDSDQKERNYTLIIEGKNKSIAFVQDVLDEQKFILMQCEKENEKSPSESLQKLIDQQKDRIDHLKNIITIPKSPSLTITKKSPTEDENKVVNYKNKLEKAKKLLENEKKATREEKIYSADMRSSLIDDMAKDLLFSSDGSDDDGDGDDDILSMKK